MNFFGHSVVAAALKPSEPFIAGSMLPDWLGITGVKLRRVENDELRAGIQFHRRTDAVFHAHPHFSALWRKASRLMREQGLPKASAWAAAHVGVELLLDGEFSRVAATHAHYEGGLRALSDSLGSLHFDGAQDAARLQRLLEGLSQHFDASRYRDVDFVEERITRILHVRPRLAIPPDNTGCVAQVLRELQPCVDGQGNFLADLNALLRDDPQP